MKKIITTILLAVATALPVPALAQAGTPVLDLNGDGLADENDATVIYDYILGIAGEGITLEMVDLDGNATVNTADVVTLYKSIVKVTGVSLNNSELVLKTGETATLIATIAPADATNQVLKWESNDKAVATVGKNGVVTAVAAGTATITVSTLEGNFTATCTVTVKSKSGIGGVGEDSENENW